MKIRQLVFWVISLSFWFIFTTCEKDKDEPTGKFKVEITDLTVSQIKYKHAALIARVEVSGNHEIGSHGFCYSPEPAPDKSDSLVNLGRFTAEESFSASIERLLPATRYYFRAFVDLPGGTIFSKEVSFTTLKTGKPSIVTDSVSSLTSGSAIFNATIISDSGLVVTGRGFTWGQHAVPGMMDSIREIDTPADNFSLNLTGLEAATTYYVQAFATNEAGTSFGNLLEFITLPEIPVVITGEAADLTTNSANCSGEVNTDGGAQVISRGTCWSTSENPTIFNSHTSDGAGTGLFTSYLGNLSSGTKYYYRAYATNSAGTAYGIQRSFQTLSDPVLPTVSTGEVTNITTTYALSGGNVLSDGGLAVTARGLCWSNKPGPNLKDTYSTDGGGTGSFITNIINLAPGTKYYVRAYATNSLGTAYGNEVSFTTETVHTVPTVTTTAATAVTSSSAVSGGNVTNTGGDAVTARGVCWSTSQNPTITNSHTIDGSGSGAYSSNITGLTASTTYYVRAYATNSIGTAYGDEMNFITHSPCTDFILTHTAGSIAPVTKTITYGTIETELTGNNKCWITQNLGADHQASYTQDDSEASAGWYWQFNLRQGYKHDGTIRTPSTSWGVMNQNSDWISINDPCNLLLGGNWRIPTYTEINSADVNGAWNNYNDTFNSDLKIHAAGILDISNGSLAFRGSQGYYWSGTQKDSGYGWRLVLYNGVCNMGSNSIQYGFTLRCIKD